MGPSAAHKFAGIGLQRRYSLCYKKYCGDLRYRGILRIVAFVITRHTFSAKKNSVTASASDASRSFVIHVHKMLHCDALCVQISSKIKNCTHEIIIHFLSCINMYEFFSFERLHTHNYSRANHMIRIQGCPLYRFCMKPTLKHEFRVYIFQIYPRFVHTNNPFAADFCRCIFIHPPKIAKKARIPVPYHHGPAHRPLLQFSNRFMVIHLISEA